jgi:hypothetical protein
MTSTRSKLVPAPSQTALGPTLGQPLRAIAAQRAEEILAEVGPTLRWLRTFLIVATISIPVFTVAFVAALWHLGH